MQCGCPNVPYQGKRQQVRRRTAFLSQTPSRKTPDESTKQNFNHELIFQKKIIRHAIKQLCTTLSFLKMGQKPIFCSSLPSWRSGAGEPRQWSTPIDPPQLGGRAQPHVGSSPEVSGRGVGERGTAAQRHHQSPGAAWAVRSRALARPVLRRLTRGRT